MVLNMNYNPRIPALLQSQASLTDRVSITVTREFVEGYVAKDVYGKFGKDTPLCMLYSERPTDPTQEFIKVKVSADV